MTRVAVIGTGTMGAAVTRRLLESGWDLNVWNRSPLPTLELAASGATAYGRPAEAVVGADIVLTWLPSADVVTEVMIDGHVLEAIAPHGVWAQMGTIGIEATERLDAEVRAHRSDVAFVDAPVSGSRVPAENGQLLILASGPETVEARLRRVFDTIGRRTLWLGRAGMGTRMKLVLNTWLAFEVEAAAEADALATRFGVASDALVAAIEGNPLASTLAAAKLSKIQSGDYQADFSLGWALKDLDLMRAVDQKDDAPVAAAIASRWHSLVDSGLGDLDVSAARLRLGQGPSKDAAGKPLFRLLPKADEQTAVTEWANVS